MGDADPVGASRRPGRDVPRRVRREPALLSQPREHPDRRLLPHPPRLPADPAVRPVRVVPRRLDARDVAARRGLPDRAVRQVHRRVPARGGDRLRPAGLGPVGGVRALGARGLHPDHRRVPPRVRARSGGPRDRGARGRGGRVRAGHDRAAVPRARDVGAARTRDPIPGRRGRVRRPAAGPSALVRRGRRLGQAGVGPRPAAVHGLAGGGDRRVPDGSVPVAPGRGPGARPGAGRARSRRPAGEHADRVHLGQRDPARGASVDEEGGAVRGVDPRPARGALGRGRVDAGDEPSRRARPEHRPRADDRRRRGYPASADRRAEPAPGARGRSELVAARLPGRAHGGHEPDPHVLRRAFGALDVRAVLDGRGGALRPGRRPVRARQPGRGPGVAAGARAAAGASARAVLAGAAGVRGPVGHERPDRAGRARRARPGGGAGVAEEAPMLHGAPR